MPRTCPRPAAPAMMGNVVIWKPARSQVYSAHVIMELFKEAGLPDGVINMVTGNSGTITDVLLNEKDFAGVHFTGSTPVFDNFWETIGKNVKFYRSYPRIVGETGGKDFVFAHKSANATEVSTALIRGAFEYQGQKCCNRQWNCFRNPPGGHQKGYGKGACDFRMPRFQICKE